MSYTSEYGLPPVNLTNAPSITYSQHGFNVTGHVTFDPNMPQLDRSMVEVRLTGSRTRTVKPDANGDYAFYTLPAGGDYTVTPANAIYTFAPASLAFDNFAGGARGANFVATPKGNLRIDGSIDDGNGHPVSGVLVDLIAPNPQ